MLRDDFNQTIFRFIGETNALSHSISRVNKPDTVTSLQYNLLEYVYLNEGVLLKKICSYMSMNIANTSREVKKLIDKGYLIKQKDKKDKRQLRVNITREGKFLIDESFFQFIKDIDKKYENLTEEDLTNLSECMNYIMKKMYK